MNMMRSVMLIAFSCWASVLVNVLKSHVFKNVEIGVESCRPVEAVIDVTLLCSGDGTLFMALWKIATSCDQPS